MKEYKRLTTKGSNYYDDRKVTCAEEIYEQLKDLEDKIENGTLIELPCKVGDRIYTCYAVSVDEWEVESIQIFDFDILFRLGHKGTNDYNSHYLSDFGERCFLTKAEAEAKLKELKEV